MKLINLGQIVSAQINEDNSICLNLSNGDFLITTSSRHRYDYRDGCLINIVINHMIQNKMIIPDYEITYWIDTIIENICNDANLSSVYKSEFLDQYRILHR